MNNSQRIGAFPPDQTANSMAFILQTIQNFLYYLYKLEIQEHGSFCTVSELRYKKFG